ncbi:MAG: FAD-binding oxidoreductase [Chloroflexi bacterium]|nr:FAD-binding oxidoreductase [Chloroflexota bacterium]
MADTADVVLIGAGVVGSSIAYHLGKRGAGKRVVVIEKNTIASGTTSAAVGGIRGQFSTEINIQFSLESMRFWKRWQDEIGLPIGFEQIGYVFLGQTADEARVFERNVALQNRMGVPSRLISKGELNELVPGIFTDDLTAIAYSPEDSRATPTDATAAYAKRAREMGVRILEGTSVTAIAVQGGKVRAVQTSQGRIETPLVVNCAGPWAGKVGELAGVDVPVKPYRREIFISEPFAELPAHIPNVIDLHVGWYCLREGAGLLMSGMKDEHSSFDVYVNWQSLATVGEFAVHRIPQLAGASWGKRAYAGLYDVSPDDHAILGPVPEVEGFLLATGFSGHGFQHSPATGRLMAELILDGHATGIDIAPLAVTRFAKGELLREPLTAHAGSMSG